jgi:hypothetical protein
MTRSLSGRWAWFLPVLMLFVAATPASAQGTSAASLTGSVTDSAGGVIPGATVEVKNNATAIRQMVITNAAGVFSLPAIDAGLYTVTVSLAGFKTVVISDLRLVTATASQVKAVLEVGTLSETIEVKGGGGLVQTQSATVQSTLSVEQLNNLPLIARNALSATTLLPGVETQAGTRASTFNGLPQNTINITLDGVSVGNNLQTGDGFYSQVFPKMDAVEEVTVTGATPGADGGAQGSVQIAFKTRSGTNNYDSSVYHYYRGPELNTNYYFNAIRGLPKNEVTLNQYGGRVGGPIVRNKTFFFFNYERFDLPNSQSKTRTIIAPGAQDGLFSYDVTGQIRTVDVLALAAANGQVATVDPRIATVLSAIRAASGTTGNIVATNNPNTQSYSFLAPSHRDEYTPTVSVDVNLTQNHRLKTSYYWQRIKSVPDYLNNGEPQFPGFANLGTQTSYRTSGSIGFRSTLSSSLVNEVKGGWQWSPVDFYSDISASQFDLTGGYATTLGFGLTNAHVVNAPNNRNTPTWNIDNTLSWLKGSHSITFGGSFTQITAESDSWNAVPTITLGLNETNDPANAFFTTGNFAGASAANLTSARQLYALLTGRVTEIGGTSRLNAESGKYEYLGHLYRKSRMNEVGLFAQDAWRLSPRLTLNYGLRWELQLPFQALTDNWSSATMADVCGISGLGSGPGGRACNIYQPGNLSGAGYVPKFVEYASGNAGYVTQWANLAPNIGVAWRPNVEGGFLRMLLGDPEQATLRAGYSVSFNRERMDRFTGIFGNNPGGTTNANRNVANGNLVNAGETWPLLLSQASRLGPPATCAANTTPTAACVPETASYPILATSANSVSIFDPELRVPFTRSYSVGVQRAINRDTVIEARYVGNRNERAWTSESWNGVNIIENKFLDEFKLAQANLRANIAANRGNTFAYTGAPGTAPLPIYLAYFQGLASSGNPASYTSANFSSTTWTQHLGLIQPAPQTAANTLQGSATFRTQALAAGLPANFFIMNPAVSGANVMSSVGGSHYHSLQMEVRRRLSQGLLVSANYTYAVRNVLTLSTLRDPRFLLREDNVPHALKMNWTYMVPVGTGRRFGSNMNPLLNGLVGNWQFSGASRIQVQSFAVNGMRLVGMTKDEVQKELKIRRVVDPTTGVLTIYSMAQDIIDNTRRAFSVDPTSATGYGALGVPTGRYFAPASTPDCIAIEVGDCGSPTQILVNGPAFVRFDLRLTKRFPLGRKASAELNIEALNVFDNINFNTAYNPGAGATIFQVTSAYRDTDVAANDPGGRLGQIVWRVTF